VVKLAKTSWKYKIPLQWNIYHNTTIWQNYSTLDSTREFSMYEVPKTEPRYVHTQHTQQQTFSHHHVFFHNGSALSWEKTNAFLFIFDNTL
jgi:hypothetical protein